MHKTCSKCRIEKPVNQFFKSGSYPSGKTKYRGDCRDCAMKNTATWRERNRSQYNNYAAKWRATNPDRARDADLKKLYGLSLENYTALLVQQSNKCAICPRLHDPARSRGRLYVDHCHKTGAVRGLLCNQCNIGIGYLQESEELLLKSIAYLKKMV